MKHEKTYTSICGGIGGIDKPLRALDWRCVYYIDNDKYCCGTFNRNFGTDWKPRDISEVDTNEIPDHTLLTSGFPCQSFSVAGERKGFSDTRGTVFFEIARILRDKRPPYFLFENVEGLLSAGIQLGTGYYQANKGEPKGEITSDRNRVENEPERSWKEFKINICQGFVLTEILLTLSELDYDISYQVLDSQYFGVPQNRERVFIIGSLRGEPTPEIFPIQGDGGETAKKRQVIRAITGGVHSGGLHSQMTGIIQPCLTPDRINKRQHGRRFKDNGESMFTLTGQDIHGVLISNIANAVDCDGYLRHGGHNYGSITDHRIRRLTPIECERLQGFPDGWTGGVSDTQRYKMLGNAVTTNVVEAIAERLNPLFTDKLI